MDSEQLRQQLAVKDTHSGRSMFPPNVEQFHDDTITDHTGGGGLEDQRSKRPYKGACMICLYACMMHLAFLLVYFYIIHLYA